MKPNFFWFIFFLICMGVGFLHGVLPEGITTDSLIAPTQIQVLTTDEVLFSPEVRNQIEKELHVRFSVTVTRDWESLTANLVASPSADLIFLPSNWAHTLSQQNLLSDIQAFKKGLLWSRVAADFKKNQDSSQSFLPIYWMKTFIQTPLNESFLDFLKNKAQTTVFLIADEDLLLKHLQIWKEQGLWELVQQKKILSLQLDQLSKSEFEGAIETAMSKESPTEIQPPFLSALLIWGAAIPVNSANKELALNTLEYLTETQYQEQTLLKTPFSSALNSVTGNRIPLPRRADYLRDIEIKDTILLESKDQDARLKLKNDFNFSL